MPTTPSLTRPSRRSVALGLPLALLIAACGAATGPSGSPGPGVTPRSTPTAVPGASNPAAVDPGTGGGGGGSGGNTGGGSDPGAGGGPIFPFPPDPGPDPILGQAHSVSPVAGLLNQRPVNVQLVRAVADADGALAELRWWSGVEPCNALDSVQIQKDEAAKAIHLTVIEGSGPGDVACIDLAELKSTVVDLGVLAPGTWHISAEGDAPQIPLEIA